MIHFTGDVVTITDPDGTRRRQRCAWCGHLLIADDSALTAAPDGQTGERAMLPERRLVAVDDGVTELVEYIAGQPMPAGACADRELERDPGLAKAAAARAEQAELEAHPDGAAGAQ